VLIDGVGTIGTCGKGSQGRNCHSLGF
jgi:hypothetical protein